MASTKLLRRTETIEEVTFLAALICLDGHYTASPPLPGNETRARLAKILGGILEKTRNSLEVREAVATNVEIWVYLTKIFTTALPNLTACSVVGSPFQLNEPENGAAHQDNSSLILVHHAILKQDVKTLIKLMYIARSLVVSTVAQDISACVCFDQMAFQTIVLCVSVLSKGYDGDVLDEDSRVKLNEVTELCPFPPLVAADSRPY